MLKKVSFLFASFSLLAFAASAESSKCEWSYSDRAAKAVHTGKLEVPINGVQAVRSLNTKAAKYSIIVQSTRTGIDSTREDILVLEGIFTAQCEAAALFEDEREIGQQQTCGDFQVRCRL